MSDISPDGYLKWDVNHPASSAKKIFDVVIYAAFKKKMSPSLTNSADDALRVSSDNVPQESEAAEDKLEEKGAETTDKSEARKKDMSARMKMRTEAFQRTTPSTSTTDSNKTEVARTNTVTNSPLLLVVCFPSLWLSYRLRVISSKSIPALFANRRSKWAPIATTASKTSARTAIFVQLAIQRRDTNTKSTRRKVRLHNHARFPVNLILDILVYLPGDMLWRLNGRTLLQTLS